MKKLRILYIDDEEEALSAMKIGLEERGYEVTTAVSGEDALGTLKKETPDVIITDLRMTPMNGFELFQMVKKIPKFKATPFFFLTAVDDFLAQKYGQTLGVDAYITKPVDLDSIDTMIRKKIKGSDVRK
jgi:CheY-like chemotaxis protein